MWGPDGLYGYSVARMDRVPGGGEIFGPVATTRAGAWRCYSLRMGGHHFGPDRLSVVKKAAETFAVGAVRRY